MIEDESEKKRDTNERRRTKRKAKDSGAAR
jgi:hypothetical protein